MYHQPAKSLIGYFIKRPVVCFIVSGLVLLAACNSAPVERYGFMTRLGTDTIAAESITRKGNTVTSDEVDRFPLVRYAIL